MDPKTLGSADLLEQWADYVGQTSTLKTKAALSRRGTAALWAAARDVEEKADLLKAEVYRRMGVALIGKTPGLVVYAASRHWKRCCKCGQTGGMNGRFLHWFTSDWYPLAYVQACNGASKKQVMEAVEISSLFCTKCATKKGAKFDSAGRPKG